MAKVTTGVYPVYDIDFKIGLKGLLSTEAEMASVKDMESFAIAIESTLEKWNPLDQGGWARALATAKAGTISLKGKRSVGDPGNDYVNGVLWKDGLDCSTKYEVNFPDGSKIVGDCVLDVKSAPGGDSTNVAALEFDIVFDGKPTFTDIPTVEGKSVPIDTKGAK